MRSVIVPCAIKPALHVGERALLRSLWDRFEPGDVVLTDCGFCSYADVFFLLRRGVDCVMRNHQCRQVGLWLVRRLGRKDRIIQWHKTAARPKWIGEEE